MTQPLFNKVCIVGVGLIGGSLGRAIKKRGLANLVIGVVRRDETAKQAMEFQALDVAVKNLKEGIADADLVILCAPVSTIRTQLKVIAPLLKKGAVVIDVGSSKKEIETAARQSLKKNIFVGCHPMAGSEKTGVENSCPDLFEKSVCFMTRPHAAVSRFWSALGSQPVSISADAHDAWAAQASHLPHLLAFVIFQNFKSPRFGDVPLNPSLRSLARLAKSNAALWADILHSNRDPMLKTVRAFKKNLASLEKTLRQKDPKALARLIQKSNQNAA